MKRQPVLLTILSIMIVLAAGLLVIRTVNRPKKTDQAGPPTAATHRLQGHELADAKTEAYANLAALETGSDTIVRATKVGEDPTTVQKTDNGRIDMIYTVAHLRVAQSFKGPLKTGEKFTVLENAGNDPSTGKVFHLNGYTLMTTGTDYLPFLRPTGGTNPMYVALGIRLGTVPVDPAKDQNYQDFMTALRKADTTDVSVLLQQLQDDHAMQAQARTKYLS